MVSAAPGDLGFDWQLISITNSSVKNVQVVYQKQGPAVEVKIEGNKGTKDAIEQTGSTERVTKNR